ncbi:hypothetical protein HELRODRAFT_167651 [Helobdella robusta]|uniref:G-protein coupled receptors family 1 profile domain-containing protein n=1 Tax=Helobdella robusta TaxID=6412 RepID=T1EZM4_HELRO|nr:hypothetical protein HELRODRAFT_167651 [Helobdella robusta]ESO09840.1 hypothetical protein HELRODRAFT_167651 [Helobdella robusta]
MSKLDSYMAPIRLICEVYISFPMVIFGLVGNSLSLLALFRYRQSPVTTILLKAITILDTSNLLSSTILRSFRYIGIPNYEHFHRYIFVWLFPVNCIIKMVSVWLTVLLTMERYTAICYPLHAQRICSTKRTKCFIFFTTVIVVLVSIPKFFEYEIVPFDVKDSGFQQTKIMSNVFYTFAFRIIFNFLFIYFVPLIALIVMNFRIFLTLRWTSRQHRSAFSSNLSRINRASSVSTHESLFEVTRSITTVAVLVVSVCIVCDIAAMISHVLYSLELTSKSYACSLSFYRRISSNISNVFLTFSCSVNFLIYCTVSRRFRLTLKSMLPGGISTIGWPATAISKRSSLDDRTSNATTQSVRRKSKKQFSCGRTMKCCCKVIKRNEDNERCT